MNAVNPIPQDTLESTLDQFDLGVITQCRAVAQGIENSNYFVQTHKPDQRGSRSEYVLTILEQAPYSGDLYQPLMAALDRAGLPVAAPLADRTGQFTGSYTDGHTTKPFFLQTRLPGKHIHNPTNEHIRALGRFLARMHKQSFALDLELPLYPRDAAWLQTKWEQIRGHISYTDEQLMQDALNRVVALLERSDAKALPQGVIHADLFRDNVLFTEHGLSAVLDFHHAAHGFLIYDLAVTANDWCNDNTGAFDPTRLMNLISAYHQVRPLTQEEIWLFPIYCLYAGLAFWQSRLWVTLPGNEHARSKNPNEFRNIVEHHLRHQSYIDPRLLGS